MVIWNWNFPCYNVENNGNVGHFWVAGTNNLGVPQLLPGREPPRLQGPLGFQESVIQMANTSEMKNVTAKTVAATRNVAKKVNILNKYDERYKEIKSQAEYREYRFKQQLNQKPIRQYWEWFEDKENIRRLRKQKFDEFWFDTPRGFLTVVGTGIIILTGAAAHIQHWCGLP